MDFSRNSYSNRVADYLRGQASQQQSRNPAAPQPFASNSASSYEIRGEPNVYDSESSSAAFADGSSADELVQFNNPSRLRVLASSVSTAAKRSEMPQQEEQQSRSSHQTLRYQPPPSAMQNQQTRPFTTTNFSDHCVLLGRGKLALSHRGNVYFRRLIHDRKERYRTASKRYEKDMIAREVVNEIHSNGGKFLRKIDASDAGKSYFRAGQSADCWVEVDDEQSLEKVKQALRDYLPASNSAKTARKTKKKKAESQDEAQK